MIDFIKVFYRSDQSHDRISYSIVLFQKKKNYKSKFKPTPAGDWSKSSKKQNHQYTK